MNSDSTRRPAAKYTKVGERLRHVIPGHMQCSMTCGGRACKYENPSRWNDQEQAIKGLYSSWITENILAMSRPSTEVIEKYNIIKEFQSHGIRTIINLQRPGEHASCGSPLEQESGFTYLPEVFMEVGIYFYNFGWKDYGVASLTTILDMVKVMAFALQEGKIAIHCHAGLGRTGVLIACYFVFATRMSADQAIMFVRSKRPGAVQTRGQLLCIREFAQFLVPLRNVFAICEPKAHAVTLSQYLIRQRHLLHGYEARQLKHIPKLIYLVCKLLLDITEDRKVVEEKDLENPVLCVEIEKNVFQLGIMKVDSELEIKDDVGETLTETVTIESFIPNDCKLVSEEEFDPLWKRRNAECLKPLTHLTKRLSYSDSDLRKAECLVDHGRTPLTGPAHVPCSSDLKQHSLSQTTVKPSSFLTEVVDYSLPSHSKQDNTTINTPPSVWNFSACTSIEEQNDGFPLFYRRKLPEQNISRRSFPSVTSPTDRWEERDYNITEKSLQIQRKNIDTEECGSCTEASKHASTVQGINNISLQGSKPIPPLIIVPEECKESSIREEDNRESKTTFEDISSVTLQSELNLESRRLLAAKALTTSVQFAEQDVKDKVLNWQKELNSRESAWERLCTEKDPLILSCLMWSWLEQLKVPLITTVDIEILSENISDPQRALQLLEKSQHQTILCILNCLASLQEIPADVEDAFFTNAIHCFTMRSYNSENGPVVYNNVKSVLRPILEEKRRQIMTKRKEKTIKDYN
ncbi:protein tyrosine phosphatase domain-containing protein 1 isoform X2 [Protopterus annectens]|uniref:protein tyrosine phosphatase domain-containing protein 1 isoform X2 n=1 Tax=Protopterus annectens TaxID=7888 RepID=UPI001CFACA3B|nr:protein tyrosine phosphatase domain-containing protein 1 isoform X2 [Protopterus annectens]XP_043934054.1 protein tyrosine phosphatase domain-containing protein 1 isoform X2 [Protopterus annectens]XP_043934055.1 protein tyrosine phosphatase domain-containing protein 1 isoform X2 [Protopterus annectens]XP_043934057.1 protein tyrosine phosphatase domain-containing protein 1 isoform X2 [Protopterus annectens]XP_043934058.1 protein tyrosine phosphatase domain-containing protein 1 isoform X2 [Pro